MTQTGPRTDDDLHSDRQAAWYKQGNKISHSLANADAEKQLIVKKTWKNVEWHSAQQL